MTCPVPLSDILSRIGDDSGHRSECLIPVDDDWKERMRAIAQSARIEDSALTSPEEK